MFLASKAEERRQEIFGVMEGGKPILYRNGLKKPKVGVIRCEIHRRHSFV